MGELDEALGASGEGDVAEVEGFGLGEDFVFLPVEESSEEGVVGDGVADLSFFGLGVALGEDDALVVFELSEDGGAEDEAGVDESAGGGGAVPGLFVFVGEGDGSETGLESEFADVVEFLDGEDDGAGVSEVDDEVDVDAVAVLGGPGVGEWGERPPDE